MTNTSLSDKCGYSHLPIFCRPRFGVIMEKVNQFSDEITVSGSAMVFPSPLSDDGLPQVPARRPVESGPGGISTNPRSSPFSILAIGISSESQLEFQSALRRTNFSYRFAVEYEEALGAVAQDPSIGVVVVDQEAGYRSVPRLAFELRAHAKRPIAIVLIARKLTLELTEVLLTMVSVSILGFPLTPEDIVRVVTTAADTYKSNICREESITRAFHLIRDALDSNDVSGHKTDLTIGRISPLSKQVSDTHAPRIEEVQRGAPSSRSIKAVRKFFRDIGAALVFINVDNAAWLMLIDLLLMETERCKIGVTALCTGVGVPVTTALKRLDELSAAGLVERVPDVIDRRRIFVCLTHKGRACVLSMMGRLDQAFTVAASAQDFSDDTGRRSRSPAASYGIGS